MAALATVQGRLLWVSLYPRVRHGDVLRMAPHWQRDLTPCLYHAGTLYVAPADSPAIFALDAGTGQILWQIDLEDATQLLGAEGQWLIASGRQLYWIGLGGQTRGHLGHVWPNGPEKLGYGRGVLAAGSVFWPTREKIYVFDQQTAELKKVIDLAALGGPRRKPPGGQRPAADRHGQRADRAGTPGEDSQGQAGRADGKRGTGPFLGGRAAPGGQSHFRGENVGFEVDAHCAAKIGTVPCAS